MLDRIKSCLGWWSSLDPRERALLNLLLIIYYDILMIIAVAFVGLFLFAIIFAFNIQVDLYTMFFMIVLTVILVISVDFFKRFYFQCGKLECFIAGRPFYYVMILGGLITGLAYAILTGTIAYLILTLTLGFNAYTSLLTALILATPTSILATTIYFRRSWYILPIVLLLTARVGVTNLFQWYLRKRGEILAKGVCRLGNSV